MPIHKNVNKDFFKKWTPEMAYVLGFFAADGYMTLNKRGGHFWNIQIIDKELLERIRSAISSEHKIGSKMGEKNEKTLYRLQIGSKEMCDDLRSLGMTERKTKSLSVSYIPEEFFSHFLRGYFDGDGNVWMGYIHKKRKTPSLIIRSTFTSCSYHFLRAVRIKLVDMCMCKGVLNKGNGNYYRLIYGAYDSLKLYDFMYNHNVPESQDIFLPRKRNIFEEYIKLRS